MLLILTAVFFTSVGGFTSAKTPTSCQRSSFGDMELNYSLPIRPPCGDFQLSNGSVIIKIPKLIPRPLMKSCRRDNIPAGNRICRRPDCLSGPCMNGWCEETMEAYLCHCLEGFSGKDCTIADQITTGSAFHAPNVTDNRSGTTSTSSISTTQEMTQHSSSMWSSLTSSITYWMSTATTTMTKEAATMTTETTTMTTATATMTTETATMTTEKATMPTKTTTKTTTTTPEKATMTAETTTMTTATATMTTETATMTTEKATMPTKTTTKTTTTTPEKATMTAETTSEYPPTTTEISDGVYNLIICEEEIANITCPLENVISILSTNYGRTDPVACPHERPETTEYTSCFLDVAADICQPSGSACNFQVGNAKFGDPCGGTWKYLNLTYTCLQAD
ncbi:location of vulva defective 1 [Strongylocentrotus purpuratus]|uniref:Uncharacterized protein n=1 Tax=Strongylocentrotus purpuratus TaxID=7668 RepID=A0A7M7P8R1_STRPU|nr:location of vulva defective 1 [Strongylocentrotus purpuratus]